MKKRLSLLVVICLVAAVVAGCGDAETETEIEITSDSNSSEKTVEQPEVSKELKDLLENYEKIVDKYASACDSYFTAIESGKGLESSKLAKAYEKAKDEFNTISLEVESKGENLESVDADYYKEVTTRATDKVVKALENHADVVQMIMEQNAN